MKLIGNIIVVFGTLIATASANAAAVNVVTDNTVPAMAASVLPVPVLGSDMVGMEATVTFSDGSTDTGSWGPTGATSGVALVLAVSSWSALPTIPSPAPGYSII